MHRKPPARCGGRSGLTCACVEMCFFKQSMRTCAAASGALKRGGIFTWGEEEEEERRLVFLFLAKTRGDEKNPKSEREKSQRERERRGGGTATAAPAGTAAAATNLRPGAVRRAVAVGLRVSSSKSFETRTGGAWPLSGARCIGGQLSFSLVRALLLAESASWPMSGRELRAPRRVSLSIRENVSSRGPLSRRFARAEMGNEGETRLGLAARAAARRRRCGRRAPSWSRRRRRRRSRRKRWPCVRRRWRWRWRRLRGPRPSGRRPSSCRRDRRLRRGARLPL